MAKSPAKQLRKALFEKFGGMSPAIRAHAEVLGASLVALEKNPSHKRIRKTVLKNIERLKAVLSLSGNVN